MKFLQLHHKGRLLNMDHILDIEETPSGIYASTLDGHLWRLHEGYTFRGLLEEIAWMP